MNTNLHEELDWRIRVFDSLSFPTLIIRPDRSVVTANRLFLDKYKITLEEIHERKCNEVFYRSENCPHQMCPIDKVLAEKKGQSTLRRMMGTHRWEDRVFSPIMDDDGNVAYVMESVRDVTRMKYLEIALRETTAFLNKVITSSPAAIVAADRYANILLMNPAAGELFGYPSLQETPGITVDRLYLPGEAQEIMKKLRSDMLGGVGKLSGIETTIVNAKGEEIPVELTASIVYEQEEEVATVGIYTDLREKLAVEHQLKEALTRLAQSEKMASMGRLAAGVAHEINNPLTGILFNASMMLENMPSEEPMRADLEEVLEDVYRCRDIVQNLLAYSRQTSPTNSIIELNALVNHSLALIRDQSLFHNITIARKMADHLMLVHVDKNQISQVIINLIMNAIDAMNGKGRLTLRTGRDPAEDKVFLEVEDTGCGIPKENLAKIFDPFFTTKTLGKGTGLGLSTAYGIVKENRGEIRVKKTGTTGTTFQLTFPVFHASDSKAILEAEQQKSAGSPPAENKT